MADGSNPASTNGLHSFVPSAENARALRNAFGQFATGVTLVTIQGLDKGTGQGTDQGGGGPMGFVANSFSSLSLDPALVIWSVAKSSRRYGHFAKAPYFAIHILAEDQAGLIDRFKTGAAGFEGLSHRVNGHGVPLIDGTLARFECSLHALHDGGDHTIIVGAVQAVTLPQTAGQPLIFAQGQFAKVDPTRAT